MNSWSRFIYDTEIFIIRIFKRRKSTYELLRFLLVHNIVSDPSVNNISYISFIVHLSDYTQKISKITKDVIERWL